jgi:hypothetical protein
MPAPNPAHSGGCRCGAVRFEANADPHHVSYCHCNDCRRATGAPVTAFVGFMTDEVSLAGDGLRTFENGDVTRSFCGRCGSPIAYRDSRIGDRIYFYLGVMDDPAAYRPTVHAHVRSQLPFLHISDDLPREPGTSVPRPDGTNP